jgi:pimeloyl-ACP methyl ester carboxylesterase
MEPMPRFVEVDGRRLEHQWFGAAGREPALVLLHEGLGSVALWRDVPEHLAALTGHRTVAYSRAGHGWSDAASLPRPVDYMHHEALTVLPAVLASLGLVGPILVGHSDGASIALIAAGSGRVRPAGLVLIAPHVFVEDCSVEGIASARERYASSDLPQRMARYHRDAEATFRGWNDVWLSPAFRDWNIEGYLTGIDVPVLVIQGRDDEYGTVAQVDAIVSSVAGPVDRLELDGCGHAPHLEARDATLAAVAAFVSRLDG